MDRSSILSLPFIMPSQAQKHVTHNEALDILDALVQLSVSSRTLATPPQHPDNAERHIVGEGASGVWAGQDGALAIWRGGWDFIELPTGTLAYVGDENRVCVKHAHGWQPVASAAPATFVRHEGVGVNADADSYNRFSINAQASLFNHEGGSHRMAMNKNASADTATLLFQSNWSGRAEMGLAGNDDFSVKISADGGAWHEAMRIDRHSGKVDFPGGLVAPGILTRNLLGVSIETFETSQTTLAPTGLSCLLTVTNGSARVRLVASLCLGADFSATTPKIGILRNGVRIWPKIADAGYFPQSASTPVAASLVAPAFIQCEDQPGEGTFVYEIALASSSGSPVYLNRRAVDAMPVGESSLSLAEVF